MNSLNSMKTLSSRFWVLISAAILINANTVLAADRVGDAQMQARDLLSGTAGRTKAFHKSLAISADDHKESYPDPQEQARRLILGKPRFDGTVQEFAGPSKTNVPVALAARQSSRVHADPQELARRMILGAGDGRESAGVRLSGIQE